MLAERIYTAYISKSYYHNRYKRTNTITHLSVTAKGPKFFSVFGCAFSATLAFPGVVYAWCTVYTETNSDIERT